MQNTKEFPTLGSLKKSTNGAWGNKNSFKDTIINLIEYEKLSEMEKKAHEQQEKNLDGWYQVPRITPESNERINKKIQMQIKEEQKMLDEGGFYIPSVYNIDDEEEKKECIVKQNITQEYYDEQEEQEEQEEQDEQDDINIDDQE
jgi:hypothetical protein